MSEMLKILLLAVMQGITEFLPISSSGHLVLGQLLLGFDAETHNLLFLNVMLHAGTLLSIVVYYWKDLWGLRRRENWGTIKLLIIGTLPVVFVGIAMKKLAPGLLASAWVAAFGLLGTAAMLLFLHRPNLAGTRISEMTWRQALIVGLMQCLTPLPGVSRSGTTISTGSRLGMEPEAAARFSFLLGVPAIGGAAVLELKDAIQEGSTGGVGVPLLAAGFLVSFVVGLISLALLIRILRRGKFRHFGYYCLALAMVTLAVLIFQARQGGDDESGQDNLAGAGRLPAVAAVARPGAWRDGDPAPRSGPTARGAGAGDPRTAPQPAATARGPRRGLAQAGAGAASLR